MLKNFKDSELEALNAKELESITGGAAETTTKKTIYHGDGSAISIVYCDDDGNCDGDGGGEMNPGEE